MTTAADPRDSETPEPGDRARAAPLRPADHAGVPGFRCRPSLLPGIGDVLVFYAPPLVVAQLLGAVARDDSLTIGTFVPYVLTFTALWFAGEVVWRGAEALIARAEIAGIQSLYIEAMDELLAKDLVVLPRQLRRLSDQADARLRAPVRGHVRRPLVPGDCEDPAAGVRDGGAVALLAAVDPGAARDAVDHGRARDPTHPAPAPARRRTRGRVERAGRTRGRFDRQRRGRSRLRPRARRGGHSRCQRPGVRRARRSGRGTTRTSA